MIKLSSNNIYIRPSADAESRDDLIIQNFSFKNSTDDFDLGERLIIIFIPPDRIDSNNIRSDNESYSRMDIINEETHNLKYKVKIEIFYRVKQLRYYRDIYGNYYMPLSININDTFNKNNSQDWLKSLADSFNAEIY